LNPLKILKLISIKIQSRLTSLGGPPPTIIPLFAAASFISSRYMIPQLFLIPFCGYYLVSLLITKHVPYIIKNIRRSSIVANIS